MSGSLDSFGSAVDKKPEIIHVRVKSLVEILSGSFGSAVDDKGENEPNKPARLGIIKSGPVFCSLPN